MPFGFHRKPKEAPVAVAPVAPEPEVATSEDDATTGGVPFDGLTEEWRLIGRMHVEGRLSDTLNRREAIAIADVSWAPVDGSGPFEPAPGLKSIDPYDLIAVLASPATLPPMSDAERAAHKVHKVPYGVALEAPPFRIVGTVYLFPGTEPERLLERATEMFLPVTEAEAFLGGKRVGEPGVEVVLVNRFYLRGVEQVDAVSKLPVVTLPGQHGDDEDGDHEVGEHAGAAGAVDRRDDPESAGARAGFADAATGSAEGEGSMSAADPADRFGAAADGVGADGGTEGAGSAAGETSGADVADEVH
jgi:hypothetical protein